MGQEFVVIGIIGLSVFFLARQLRSFIKGEICCECPSSRRNKSCCPVQTLARLTAKDAGAQSRPTDSPA